MGLSMLSGLKGVVLPVALSLYLAILFLRKKYFKFKLFLYSLIVSIFIGSYQFIKNFLTFGSPFGYWRTQSRYIIHYDWIQLYEVFRAYWGGIYGGNESINLILGILITILVLITIYSLISRNFGLKLNLDFVVLLGLIVILLIVNMTCNLTYFLKSFECIGATGQGRYLVPLNPVIAIFPSIVLASLKNNFLKKLGFLFVFVLCTLFAFDFIWAFF